MSSLSIIVSNFSRSTTNKSLSNPSNPSYRRCPSLTQTRPASHTCTTYQHSLPQTMLELLTTFNNTRNDIVDERITCFLREIEWFRKTFESENLSMRKFIKNFELMRTDKFTKIVRRGELSDYFYVLVKGKASVLKEREIVVDEMEKVQRSTTPVNRNSSFIER